MTDERRAELSVWASSWREFVDDDDSLARMTVALAAGVGELLAENEALRSTAPGTPLAVLDALFAFAEKECGHHPCSATHALTTVEQWVASAKHHFGIDSPNGDVLDWLACYAENPTPAVVAVLQTYLRRAAFLDAAEVLAGPTAKEG